MSNAYEPLPAPKDGERIVLPYVLEDLKHRAVKGKEKYGTFLMTNNGRSALWDAYQEVLDLAMYLRQRILEDEENEATRDL